MKGVQMLEMVENFKNQEGYPDPTAEKAIKKADEAKKFFDLLKAIWKLCDEYGFRMEGRIQLRSKSSGKLWK